jgi:hypothetical protein
MKLFRILPVVLILILGLSACAASEPVLEADDTSPTEETPAPTQVVEADQDSGEAQETPATGQPAVVSGTAGSFFAINEIGLGPEGFIAMTNFTDVPVSMSGLYLCQASDCFALPDAVVAAGETVRVAAGGGDGVDNVVATGATFGELSPPDGEIAIFTSDDTEDPEALLLYLQWGSTPHELTELAVDKGLWFETSFAPSGENATRLWRIEETGLWVWE